MNPLSLLSALPWLLLVASLIGGAATSVVYRMKWQGDEIVIAQKDTALKGMQAQQAENIAAAEAKARQTMQADLAHSNQLVADYAAEIAALQEKGNAADVDLASVQVAPTAQGCPEPMALPVVRAFRSGLPDE